MSSNNSVNLANSCIHCLHGKMHRLPFPSSRFVANSPFELVHTNLWGPAPLDSINGYKYYVIFVDHFTRFTWLYLLTNKSEVYSKFVMFHAMVKIQFSSTIKVLRLDWGGEYTSKSFESFLSSNGIHHQISCPYTPQQNDLVERKHRHLIKTTITLLSQASLPSTYWSFTVQFALTLINLLPTATLDFLSPWFKFHGQHPNIFSLKIFGCACYPFFRPYNQHKLNHKTTECIFLLIYSLTNCIPAGMYCLMRTGSLFLPHLLLPHLLNHLLQTYGCPIYCTSTFPISPLF